MTSRFFPITQPPEATAGRLFQGIWIRWQQLSATEVTVCAVILLMPLWWVLGAYNYLPSLVTLAIAWVEFRRYGRLRLGRIGLLTLSLLALYLYGDLRNIGTALSNGEALGLSELAKMPFKYFDIPLLWYIQSHRLQVRPLVLAWALSASVVQLLFFWAVIQFALGAPNYNPFPSVYGILTGKGDYQLGANRIAYLIPYVPRQPVVPGIPRYALFFAGPIELAQYVSFIGLLALDLKNRLWSRSLLVACLFLIFLSASRQAWVFLPIVMVIHWLVSAARRQGVALVCALIALLSFLAFSVPPISAQFFGQIDRTTTAVSEFREGSTEERGEIYTKTLERIPEKPLFGHYGIQETVKEEGSELQQAKTIVGSHSHFLGLFYNHGLLGSCFFWMFWLTLLLTLYETRLGRPLAVFMFFLLCNLLMIVSLFNNTLFYCLLLCLLLRQPLHPSRQRKVLHG